MDEARAATGSPRGFADAILSADGDVAIISEVKRRSPSKGDLLVDLDAAELARSYERGGAACLSVLTDSDWFGGSTADLRDARAAVGIPTLRKDFTIDSRDVADARIMGADCVLLIVAALDQSELSDFHDLAVELGLDVLVEVHDEAEVQRALSVGATIVGVNQRDLVTFEVDQDRAVRLGTEIPDNVVRVAESGIRGRPDAEILIGAGYQALLVGETLVRSGDPAAEVSILAGL